MTQLRNVCEVGLNKGTNTVIVNHSEPVTLVGGAELRSDDLNIALAIAPRVVAADGGANHLLSMGITPDAIYGDFDSISDKARTKFSDRMHHIACQNTTDFQKVLNHTNAPVFIAVGFLGQRLDHTFAALHAAALRPDLRIVFINEDEAVCILNDQSVQMQLPKGSPFSVLPLGQARVHTSGLKWDLDDAPLSMKGAISSSNETENTDVEVTVQGTVAITCPKSQLVAAVRAMQAG